MKSLLAQADQLIKVQDYSLDSRSVKTKRRNRRRKERSRRELARFGKHERSREDIYREEEVVEEEEENGEEEEEEDD